MFSEIAIQEAEYLLGRLWELHRPSVEAPPGKKIIVFDVETTGLTPYDRIISVAALRLIGSAYQDGPIYLVFDPRKDSHPAAEAVHGWDNWTTRYQDLFADHAEELREWFGWADIIVSHNIGFDWPMLNREFRKAGVQELSTMTFCTLQAARSKWPGESNKLDACIARIGYSRSTARHGAFEDAFLAMNLYLALSGSDCRFDLKGTWPSPTNLKAAPPRPVGDLPRRETKKPKRKIVL